MKTQIYSFFIAWLLSSFITISAWGDDLEIYLGTNESETLYLPNVLFIMDSSGSMASLDGGTESRLLRVQNALSDVLSTATNINAGLMRFSNIGGPILYPVTDLDGAVSTDLVYAINSSDDDAHEINEVVTTNADNIVITNGSNEVMSGFRFENVRLPQGATITRAYIRLFSAGLDSSSEVITIAGELSGDSVPFSTNNRDISSRSLSGGTLWSLNNHFPVADELVTTPDLSGVIQEIVNQDEWCGGNALSVVMTSSGIATTGNKRALSVDNGTGLSPQLVINYDSGQSGGCLAGDENYQVQSQDNNVEEQADGTDSTGNDLNFSSSSNSFIGVRFTNVVIPQGATIKSAKLILTASNNSNSNTASVNIRGIAQDNPDDYSDHTNFQLRDAAKTSAINMTLPEFDRNDTYESPDISEIVQQIVNRSGWNGGNAMAFVFSDFVGSRTAHTYSGNASRAVKLEVTFEGDSVPGSTQTVRDLLSSLVFELSASGSTPIVDTLYEAVSYYAGNPVDYGLTRGNSSTSSSVRRSTRVSHELSYIGQSPVRPSGCSEDNLSDNDCREEYIPAGAVYQSPISDLQCQTNNHIVLLSDGEAVGNTSQSRIQNLLGIDTCTGSGDEECGLDLVKNISDADESAVGTTVTTHTIGFASNNSANNYLNQLATQSGGSFFTADNSENLIEAFNTILQSVQDVSATFVSPGVAVNQLNRLTHRDELYYAVFEPDEGVDWAGNLKRYRISNNEVLDSNGQSAVDSNTGFFRDNIQSFWSLFADGSDIAAGGAASLLTASRNLYIASGTGPIATSTNELNEGNSDITEAMLGIDNEANATVLRDVILKWARGVDVRDADGDGDITDIRFAMGDPIHSQPTVVDYSDTETAIFVATNQGYLHSFDAETGIENFAIIPEQLLPNLQDFYFNQDTITHTYGLDGDLMLRTDGDKKYLYVGMRRGGSSYFAFDISNSSSPELMFTISAGDTGLENMGQSWSQPTVTKVNINGTAKNVLIIGGGYDEAQDTKSIRSADTVGNAVYMFDADTGALLWSAGNDGNTLVLPSMQYSIPGRISVIDRDNDGLADHMYVSDMGGQLFRFDIYNDNTGIDFITGGQIADFSGDSEEDNRRFYYGPDVARVSLGSDLYYAVAIGSGKRASPLDRVIQDRFYLLRDQSVFNLAESGEYTFPDIATESDMYDATLGLLASADSTVVAAESSDFANSLGWLIDFSTAGEKVLASPTIIDHSIFFTTYIPAQSDPSVCAPTAGSSRAYLVNLLNANAVNVVLETDDETDNVNARFEETSLQGIPPEPTFNVEANGKVAICLGTVCTRTEPEVSSSGTPVACTSGLGCLTENIFADRERVRRNSWRTETEVN